MAWSLFGSGDQGEPAAYSAVGLIAGTGDFPVLVARAAEKRRWRLVVAGVEMSDGGELARLAAKYRPFVLGEAEKLLSFFKEEGVRTTFMAGGIPKKKIYSAEFKADALTRKVMGSLTKKGDDHLLRTVTQVLKLRGIGVLDPAAVLEEDLAPKGILTRRAPSPEEMKDIETGRKAAKAIGYLDIGQAVAVRGASIMAVEAIEGTDAMIARVGELRVPGAVIVKTSKPQQDLRFDMPVTGPATIEAMRAAGCTVLAVEARRSLILFRSETIQKADAAGIAVIGI